MSDVKTAYASSTTFTCTLASLTSSATAGRESTVVDNSSNKYLDALVQMNVKLQTGTPANDKAVYVLAYASIDGGTTYPDAVTGSDAAITLNDPPQLVLLGSIYITAAGGLTWKGGPWAVARCFGGVLPEKWGIVVRNYTGVTLSATEGDHFKAWQGIYTTVV
jgi:hypothetical protein